MLLCTPLLAAAQGALPDRFGYCFAVDVPSRTLWTTPVYEFDIPHGHLFEQTEQDKAQFRARIAQGAPLAADTDAVCTYKATRAEAETDIENTRKAFRFSRVDWKQVAWNPTSARPAAAPASMLPASPPTQVDTPAQKARPPETGNIETDFWNRIADSQVPEDFDDYLKAFPKGRHAPLARLEARRLRRGTSSPAATAAPIASAAPVSPVQASNLEAPVAQALAGDPFFRMPAGKGAQATWAGRRMVSTRVGDRVIQTPLVQTSTLKRDGDTCRIDVHVETGTGSDVFTTDSHGATWAGFVPLDLAGRTSSKYGTSDSTVRAIALRHGTQPLFPLQAGATANFSVTTRNAYQSQSSDFEQAWTCRVGATVAAATLLPGTPGDATELTCEMTMPGIPGGTSFAQVYQWLGDVGCFVQDPNRP
jgi:hypothetical protein